MTGFVLLRLLSGALTAAAAVSIAGEARASGAVAWVDSNAGYPLIVADGSNPSTYIGVLRLGGRLGGVLDNGLSLGLGLDHIVMRNAIDGSRRDDADGHSVASSHITTFACFLGGGWHTERFLATIYSGFGMSWRSFEQVKGVALAGYFSGGGTFAWYLGDSQDYFIGPAVEIAVVSDGVNSDIGWVAPLTAALTFGITL